MVGRLSKIAMCLVLGLFAALVAVDNIIDYGANYAFVQHVLSMDTVEPGNPLIGRAVTDPALWHAGYDLIIGSEALVAVLFLAGAIAMGTKVRASAAAFQKAKGSIYAAGSLGFVLWFFGFMVVGGEWFQMWQSSRWNGQEAAFRFTTVLLAVLIFIGQPDGEPTAH